MSIWTNPVKVLTNLAKGGATAGPAGVVFSGTAGLAKGLSSVKAGNLAAKALPALPGIGKAVAGGIAGDIIWDAVTGQPVGMKKKRKRGKGISARDLRSFKRVARLVDKFAKPVHHMRNFKAHHAGV